MLPGIHLTWASQLDKLRRGRRPGLIVFICRLQDMGLGKTVQVISFLAALLGKTGTELDRLRPCERPGIK